MIAADAVCMPGAETRLAAYVMLGRLTGLVEGIEDVDVTFRVAGRIIDEDDTNDDGYAHAKVRRLPRDARAYTVSADVLGKAREARGRLYQWRRDRTIIVVDIDGTIADTDYDDLIFRREDRDSQPLPEAAATLHWLAEHANILYLTARPWGLLDKTRVWLERNGFPDGPVFPSTSVDDLLAHDEFKERVLADLQDDWPGLLVGVGDKATDAAAYGEGRMVTVIVAPKQSSGRQRCIQFARDWRDARAFFDAHLRLIQSPRDLRAAIEAGQFGWHDDDEVEDWEE